MNDDKLELKLEWTFSLEYEQWIANREKFCLTVRKNLTGAPFDYCWRIDFGGVTTDGAYATSQLEAQLACESVLRSIWQSLNGVFGGHKSAEEARLFFVNAMANRIREVVNSDKGISDHTKHHQWNYTVDEVINATGFAQAPQIAEEKAREVPKRFPNYTKTLTASQYENEVRMITDILASPDVPVPTVSQDEMAACRHCGRQIPVPIKIPEDRINAAAKEISYKVNGYLEEADISFQTVDTEVVAAILRKHLVVPDKKEKV